MSLDLPKSPTRPYDPMQTDGRGLTAMTPESVVLTFYNLTPIRAEEIVNEVLTHGPADYYLETIPRQRTGRHEATE